MEFKLDFAGRLVQFDKPPTTLGVAERSVAELHFDQVRRLPNIFGSEALLEMMIVDMNRRFERFLAMPLHLRSTAPGKEIRIIFDTIDQHEHLPSRVKNQHGFFHYYHSVYRYQKLLKYTISQRNSPEKFTF